MSNKARRFEPSFSAAFARSRGIGSRWHRWINPIQNLPLARYFTNHWLGLAPGRPLPSFSKSLFRRWKPDASTAKPSVILMADCFSCFYDSDLGLASIQLLEAFGYQVVLEDVGCCGRSIFRSEGLGRPEKTSSKRLRLWKNSESDTPRWVLSHWSHPVPARCRKTGQN